MGQIGLQTSRSSFETVWFVDRLIKLTLIYVEKILSLGKSQYLGATTDLRFADGVVFSAVSSFAPEIGHDAPHFHENTIVSFILEGDSFEKTNRETKLQRAETIKNSYSRNCNENS